MARTIPLTATKSSGQLITGALWNAGQAALAIYTLSVPMFRGWQNSSQNLTSGSMTAMNLNITDVDTDSGHSNVSNNSRYTAQVAGWYWVEGYVALANAGAASHIYAAVARNGTQVAGTVQLVGRQTDLQSVSASALVQLSAGQYVEIWGHQNSGSTVATFPGSDLAPCMNIFWVHS